jgi:GTP-binding protein
MVALVGRPNVGKSMLFNRLVGERMAVTHEIPGTTRDRLQAEFDWRGADFRVVDTGGIEVYEPKGSRDESPLAEGSKDFVPQIQAQALMAVNDADVIVMVVDIETGMTAADEEVAEILRRSQKPVVVAANKADHVNRFDDAMEFYSLGLGEVYPISAIHGLGVGDLLDGVFEAAGGEALLQDEEAPDDDHMKIAIVGRPNVGKSSLLNRLLGEERVIVSPVAGTTRDAIDTDITYHGERVTLIDTAGIRKRGKIEPGVEKFSVIRAMNAVERADVVLVLIDATEGVTEQDQHIAGYVIDAGKSVVLIANKWDVVEKDNRTLHEYELTLRAKFDFVPNVPILFISALTGQRIHQVLEMARRVWEARHIRIATSELNQIVRDAVQTHTPPVRGTRRLKVLYATQVAIAPPLFLVHVNDPKLVHFSYRRFLENQIRKVYPFEGTPIRMSFRAREAVKEK